MATTTTKKSRLLATKTIFLAINEPNWLSSPKAVQHNLLFKSCVCHLQLLPQPLKHKKQKQKKTHPQKIVRKKEKKLLIAGFLNIRSTGILNWILFYCWGCPMPYRIFKNIPGLHQLHDRHNALTHSCDNQKCV